MRLMYVLSQFSLGGAENHVADLVADQVRRGNDVMVLGLREGQNDPSGYRALLKEHGATTEVPQSPWQGKRCPPGLLWWMDRRIRGFGPDLIHTHLPAADIAVAAWRRLCRVRPPVVSTVHGWEPRYSGTVNRWLLRQTYNRADALIAVSGWLKTVTSGLGVDDDLFSVVHHGQSTTQPLADESPAIRAELRETFGGQDVTVIGTVGRLAVQKGIDVLIQAVSRLPEGFRLVVLGADEGEGDSLAALAEELGVSQRCRFVGFQQDPDRWISAFDVFALPSRWEGFGLVLLEAGGCGVPVVATDIAPINEIIRNGCDGLLVPVDDPDALAQAIQRVALDPALSDRLRQSFSCRIATEFSESRMLDSVSRIYDELLGTAAT